MSAETPTKEAREMQPKSKRLSSLIWIVVLWLFVYLISGNWTAFRNNVLTIGALPSSIFLFASAFQKATNYQSVFRWFALIATVTSLTFGVVIFGVGSGVKSVELFNIPTQIFLTVATVALVLWMQWIRGNRND
jgi:hypothetical protein